MQIYKILQDARRNRRFEHLMQRFERLLTEIPDNLFRVIRW